MSHNGLQPKYTVGYIKTCYFIWDHNSHVSWWIFALFAPMETGKNTLLGITKFATLPQLCLYTTWENLKTHTRAHFDNGQMSVYFNAQRHQRQERVQVNCFKSVCSKCPPFSRTEAARRSLHWSTALSMICCSSSFQTVSRRCRSSSVFWMWRNYDVITDEEPLNK